MCTQCHPPIGHALPAEAPSHDMRQATPRKRAPTITARDLKLRPPLMLVTFASRYMNGIQKRWRRCYDNVQPARLRRRPSSASQRATEQLVHFLCFNDLNNNLSTFVR